MIVGLALSIAAAAPPVEQLPEEEQEVDVRRGGNRTREVREWGFDTRTNLSIDVEDEDPEMIDFAAAELRKPPAPVHAHLYPGGRVPLTDVWDLYVSAFNEQLVVMELPVLVAQDRAAFVAEHPHGILLVGEYASGVDRVVVRQEIRPDDVVLAGPTIAFLKAALPNPKPVDQVRVLVKVAELPAPPLEGASPAPAPVLKDRFARTTVYAR